MQNPIAELVKIEKAAATRWVVRERDTDRRLGEFWKNADGTIRLFLAVEFSADPSDLKMEELPYVADRQGDAIMDIHYYTVGDGRD